MKYLSLKALNTQSLLRQAFRVSGKGLTAPGQHSLVFCGPSSLALRFYTDSSESSIPKEVITERIFEVLKKYEKIDASKITAEAHFSKDLKLDSLDAVEVVMAIEEEFSIEIPDQAADEIKSVSSAIDYVASRKDAH